MSYPELRYMQTENECGDGENTWFYAKYVFNLFQHYFTNGVNAYIYWNMALEPKGRSTWGWEQNAMVTVHPEARTMIFNPEFFVMKHFSHFVVPGSRRLGVRGHWTGNSVAFLTPSGDRVVVIANPFVEARTVTISFGEEAAAFELAPESFNTIVCSRP
jgi:glucosylceramidase